MMNWKQIIAAAGTAALLISNMGSVTQLAFATENITESTETSEGSGESDEQAEPTAENEIEVQVEEPAQEVAETPAAGEGSGESGTGSTGTENGETGTGNSEISGTGETGSTEGGNTNEGAGESETNTDSDTSNDENQDGTDETGDNDNADNAQNGEEINESGDAKGADETTGTDGADENQTTDGTTVTPGNDVETPADGEVVNPTDPAAEEIDPEEPAEDEEDEEETVTYALDDSLTVELETKESSKREVTRDEDDDAYLYDLGETASTTITLTNPEDYSLEETDGAVVRVYMQFEDNKPTTDADETTDAKDSKNADTSDEEDADDKDDANKDADDASDNKKSTDPEDLRGKTRKPGEYTVEAEPKETASEDKESEEQTTEDEQNAEAENADNQQDAENKEDSNEAKEPNEYTYTVTEVEDGLYCYEIERPIEGDTIVLELTSVYGANSYGGENHVWTQVMTLDEAAELDEVDMSELDKADESDDEDQDDADSKDAEEKDSEDADDENSDEEKSEDVDDKDSEEKESDDVKNSEEEPSDDGDENSDDLKSEDSDKERADDADNKDADDEKSDNASDKDANKASADDKGSEDHKSSTKSSKQAHKVTLADRIAYYNDNRDEIKVAKAESNEDVTILRWVEDVIDEEEESEIQVQTAETENYIVSVAYGPEANIPEDAELRVIEYDEDSEEYQKASEQAGDVFTWLLDISLYDGDEEIEPEQSISISVTPKSAVQTLALEDDSADGKETLITEQKVKDLLDETLNPAEENALPEYVDGVDTSSYDYIFANANMAHFTEDGVVEAISEIDGDTYTFVTDSLSIFAGLNGGIEMEYVQPENEGLALLDLGDDTAANALPEYQPTYTDEPVSDAKTGIDDKIEGIDHDKYYAEYASDKPTSNIEDAFTGTETQNGKAMTDKSVIYMGDDYNSGLTYSDGEFGVTLSALAQEYVVTETTEVISPIDVVFILDVSGSMKKVRTFDGVDQTRMDATVNAVNSAIEEILDANEDNRIGVALFSSGSTELLPIDRYEGVGNEGSKQYVVSERFYSESQRENRYRVKTAVGLKNDEGREFYQDNVNIEMQGLGTYTQAGLAAGRNLFSAISNDITVTKTVNGHQYTLKRQPVFILLSDGDPTHASSNYQNPTNSNAAGNGNTGNRNNKGILGYYTILSANYFKDEVSKQYGLTGDDEGAKFYTIGMGIYETSDESSDGSASGDHYKRAVLNPDSANIDHLSSYVGQGNTQNNRRTAGMLYQLLKNSYTGNSVDVVSGTNIGDLSWTAGSLSVTRITNTDYSENKKGYSYADVARFGELSEETLKSIFDLMIKDSQKTITPEFKTGGIFGVVLQDSIGDGMEVKGAPVLRVGNQNFTKTGEKVEEDPAGDYVKTVQYIYSYTPTYQNVYGANYGEGHNTSDHHKADSTLDLSHVLVQVLTDENGKQTVVVNVPEDVMPALYQTSDESTFYYRESPIRLIYKVGLTQASIDEVNALGAGETKTYYTNIWPNTKDNFTTYGEFGIAEKNTYEFNDANGNGQDTTGVKEENTTGTEANYFFEYTAGSGQNKGVMQVLGNNGSLTFKGKYELPSTGGMGTLPYELGGSAALLASMFAGCSSLWRRRRDGRRCE